MQLFPPLSESQLGSQDSLLSLCNFFFSGSLFCLGSTFEGSWLSPWVSDKSMDLSVYLSLIYWPGICISAQSSFSAGYEDLYLSFWTQNFPCTLANPAIHVNTHMYNICMRECVYKAFSVHKLSSLWYCCKWKLPLSIFLSCKLRWNFFDL